MAGVKLPSFLFDEEISASSSGAMKIVRLVGGTALSIGIVAAGAWVYSRVTDAAGVDSGTNVDLSVGA